MTWEVVEHDDRFVDDDVVAEYDTEELARREAAEWNLLTRSGLTYVAREVMP